MRVLNHDIEEKGNEMKKALTFIALSAIMAFCLASCGGSSLPNSVTKGNLTISYPDGWNVKEETGGAILGLSAGDSCFVNPAESNDTMLMVSDVSAAGSTLEKMESTLTEQGIDFERTKVSGKDALRIDTVVGTVKNGSSTSDSPGKAVGVCATDGDKVTSVAMLVLPEDKYNADKTTYDAIIDSASMK